jgi:hypothetical protein
MMVMRKLRHSYIQCCSRNRIPATVFLVSEKISASNTWDEDMTLRNRQLLTWEEIGAMDAEIIQFGAHSCNHPILTEISNG